MPADRHLLSLIQEFWGLPPVGHITGTLEEKCCTTSVINLEPRSAFPINPTEGDLCVVGESGNHHIYCYLNGDWARLDPPGDKAPPRK